MKIDGTNPQRSVVDTDKGLQALAAPPPARQNNTEEVLGTAETLCASTTSPKPQEETTAIPAEVEIKQLQSALQAKTELIERQQRQIDGLRQVNTELHEKLGGEDAIPTRTNIPVIPPKQKSETAKIALYSLLMSTMLFTVFYIARYYFTR